jgi:CDP-diglyceride synthetase
MIDLWVEFVKSLWLLFPMYAANGFPPLAKGEIPIDLNKNFFDGNRILGDGKTFEGFSLGLLAGFLIGALETYLYPNLCLCNGIQCGVALHESSYSILIGLRCTFW